MKCEHDWRWQHSIITGRRDGVCIVRQCSICKRKEMAHIPEKQWTKATGDYARDEHYK